MVMVYIPREGARFGDGDKIKWQVGEPAVFHSSSGETYNVTIVSHFVTHEATPDKRCIEVMFEDDGRIGQFKRLGLLAHKTYTVLAERLEPRGGFPSHKRGMEMDEPAEPLIHSNREDVLPDNHPWAQKQVHCSRCGVLVHAFNNENMQTWVEGMFQNQDCELSHLALCVVCFAKLEREQTKPNLIKQWFPPGPHENPSEWSVIETLAQALDAVKQILRQEFPEADPARLDRAIERIADVADAYARAEWSRGLAEGIDTPISGC